MLTDWLVAGAPALIEHGWVTAEEAMDDWPLDLMFLHAKTGATVGRRCAALAASLLREAFGTPERYGPCWRTFGDEYGSCVEILGLDGRRVELFAHISASQGADVFIDRLCIIAEELGCSLTAVESGQTLGTSSNAVRCALMEPHGPQLPSSRRRRRRI